MALVQSRKLKKKHYKDWNSKKSSNYEFSLKSLLLFIFLYLYLKENLSNKVKKLINQTIYLHNL